MTHSTDMTQPAANLGCPFCGGHLGAETGQGHRTHLNNGCILGGLEFSQGEVDKWNLRTQIEPVDKHRTVKPLPALHDGQSWCCDHGCGETTPLLETFEYSRHERADGTLIERKVAPVWRSRCCGESIFLYDEKSGDSTPWED